MKIVLVAFVALCFASCKSYYRGIYTGDFRSVDPTDTINETFRLADFDVYVFRLCERQSFNVKSRELAQTMAFPQYGDCENAASKIVEETYLLFPKDNNDDRVIYITTMSHKYLHPQCGVFNCSLFRDKIFIEDVDVIFTGRVVDNQILFYRNTSKLSKQFISRWTFDKNGDMYTILDVTLAESKSPIKPQMQLSQVFSLPIHFNKTEKTFRYGKNASEFFDRCYRACDLPQSNIYGVNIGGFGEYLYITDDHFYFTSVKDRVHEYYKFPASRMPYSSNYPGETQITFSLNESD